MARVGNKQAMLELTFLCKVQFRPAPPAGGFLRLFLFLNSSRIAQLRNWGGGVGKFVPTGDYICTR